MLLIGQFDSPFVRRVAIALRHYEMPFEHRPWSVWGQADQIAQYNPLRRVPVLVLDDGEVLLESTAILDAVDELAPGDRLLIPRTGAARRATLRVCAVAAGLADKSVSLLYEHVLRNEDRRSSVWIDRCRSQIRDALGWLERERVAAEAEYWFGILSHADIAVACALRFLGEAHPDLGPAGRYPALSAHSERCEALALFQSAVQRLSVAV
jgi:glutathione S-transferase